MLLVVAAGTLNYSGLFAVGLPALSRNFDNGSLVLGAMVSAWGLGQLVGTLSATRHRPAPTLGAADHLDGGGRGHLVRGARCRGGLHQ
ncbi:MAG: hypothetical protein ACRDQ5_05135 [Sciscionella sp.]